MGRLKSQQIEKHDADRQRQAEQQIDGDHYAGFDVDPARWCYRNGLDSLQAYVVKHTARADLKGEAVTDLQKAIHYLTMKLEEDHDIVTTIIYTTDKAPEPGCDGEGPDMSGVVQGEEERL